jgi:hypothetical protein
MMWQPCDLFRCTNAECKSEVLVLQSPRTALRTSALPQCVCGHSLERVPYGVEDPLRAWNF